MDKDAELCEQVSRYIRDNISQILTLQDAAKHFYISKRHLSRKLDAYYHKGFRALANEIRCEYAKGLLAYSGLPVCQISKRLGFSGSANFNHFFIREEGVSPTDFRKRFNEGHRVKQQKLC